MSVETSLTSTVRNCGRVAIAMASLSVVLFGLQSQAQSPLRQAARWGGYGWGDGYHACQPSKYQLGGNLPPRLPARHGIVHRFHTEGKYQQRFGATYYDHFDAGSHQIAGPHHSHRSHLPIADCDEACDAIPIHESDHVPLPVIDAPENTQAPVTQAPVTQEPITQEPITQTPRETRTFSSAPFATEVTGAEKKKLPIKPMPPSQERNTDQAPAFVRFFENLGGEKSRAGDQFARGLMSESMNPQSNTRSHPQRSTPVPNDAKTPSLASAARAGGSSFPLMPSRIGGGSSIRGEITRQELVLDMSLSELSSMLASPQTTTASVPQNDEPNETPKSQMALQPPSYALPPTNPVSKTSKLPAVQTRTAASGFEMPTPSNNFTGPNQTGPYQILVKNPTSTANPEATASTLRAASTLGTAVNDANSISPPQGITYPVASQPAFLASQPAHSMKSQPLAVTAGSPATVSQSPSVSNRSTSELQPPSYAREAPRPIRLGGQTDRNRQKQQIKIPRQANNQSIAPIAGGIRINPLANRSKLEISHRQASPADTIQQPKLR